MTDHLSLFDTGTPDPADVAVLSTRVTDTVRAFYVAQAAQRGLTLSDVVREALEARMAPQTTNGGYTRAAVPANWDRPDDDAPGQHRHDDGATARLAALQATPRTGTQRRRILQALLHHPDGLTPWELVDWTAIPYGSLTPRIGELKLGGWATTTGATRTTPYKAQADVLVATPKAHAWAETEPDA